MRPALGGLWLDGVTSAICLLLAAIGLKLVGRGWGICGGFALVLAAYVGVVDIYEMLGGPFWPDVLQVAQSVLQSTHPPCDDEFRQAGFRAAAACPPGSETLPGLRLPAW